jgi:hypothetical protein
MGAAVTGFVTCACGEPILTVQVAALHIAAVRHAAESGASPAQVLTKCSGCGALFGIVMGDVGYQLLQIAVPGVLGHAQRYQNSVN